MLDIAKVCDVILFTLSCKNIDISNWKKDPDIFANAIDQRGYEILMLLKSQGLPVSIGVLMDIDLIKTTK